MGAGLGYRTGVTRERHNSELMFPTSTTTTTTTTLSLPDSRARMMERAQENKKKNKIEE